MNNRHVQLAATVLVAFSVCGCVPDEVTVRVEGVETSGEDSSTPRAAEAAAAAAESIACRKNLTMENSKSAHLQDGQRLRLTGPYEAEGHYKVRPIGTSGKPEHHMKPDNYLVYNVSTGAPPDRDFQTVITVDKGPHSVTETDHMYIVTIKGDFDEYGCPSEVLFVTTPHKGDEVADPDHGGHSTGRD